MQIQQNDRHHGEEGMETIKQGSLLLRSTGKVPTRTSLSLPRMCIMRGLSVWLRRLLLN